MPGSPPLVSIVLPTYNGSTYLREAIDSCLAQTYQSWELVLVDDASVDETPRIIAEYAARDQRIRCIRHQTNRKLPEALNTGHAAARGDYLMWTSDDNRFFPSAVEELTRYLKEHPAIGLVYADSVLIDEAGRYVREYPAQPASALAYMNAIGPCFLYRRRVYETVGSYSADLFLAEDYDYWLRVYRRFEVAHLPRTLYEYRWHGDSLTSSTGNAVWTSVERTLRINLPYLSRPSRSERARGWIVCATTAARRRALLPAAEALGKAVRLAPLFSLGYLGRKLWERGPLKLRAGLLRSSQKA